MENSTVYPVIEEKTTCPTDPDSRQHPRRVLVGDGKLLVAGYEECPCTMADVSTCGMAVFVNRSFSPNTECVVSTDLYVGAARKRINAWGRIVYAHWCTTDRYRMGIEFMDMDGYSGLILREANLGERN